MDASKIPVLIADDHALVRTGLRIVINNSSGYFVAGEATSGGELLPLLQAEKGRFIILDLQMQPPPADAKGGGFTPVDDTREELFRQYSGLLILQNIRRFWPDLRVLIITQYDDPAVIEAAVRLNVDGFLLKDELNEAILEALDAIGRGERAFSERVRRIQERPPDAGPLADSILSPREREVLELVAHGFRDREISERLNIAPRTVAFHKANIKEKLNADSTAEIIAYYYSGEKNVP